MRFHLLTNMLRIQVIERLNEWVVTNLTFRWTNHCSHSLLQTRFNRKGERLLTFFSAASAASVTLFVGLLQACLHTVFARFDHMSVSRNQTTIARITEPEITPHIYAGGIRYLVFFLMFSQFNQQLECCSRSSLIHDPPVERSSVALHASEFPHSSWVTLDYNKIAATNRAELDWIHITCLNMLLRLCAGSGRVQRNNSLSCRVKRARNLSILMQNKHT